MTRATVPPPLAAWLAALSLSLFVPACGPTTDAPDGGGEAAGGTGGIDPGSGGSDGGPGGTGATGGTGGAGGTGGTGGTGDPTPGAPLLFRSTAPVVLADTGGREGSCGAMAPIEGTRRRLTVDLDDCDLPEWPAGAVGLVGSITVETASTETLELRVAASDAAAPGAPIAVGPHGSVTHGFVTLLGADRTFVVEVDGTAAARLRIEASAALVPEADGGDYVHLFERPLRWFASNPNDDGFRDVWPRLDTALRYPVAGAERGATGMFGTVHLGPAVWRDAPVTFHLGAAGAATLPRWASVPTDAHFPWRYSSFFVAGANPAGEIELRASSDVSPEWETGPEPWVDAAGFLSPEAGLVYRPLDRPLAFAAVETENEEDARFPTGLAGAAGVIGSIDFDLPHWPYDERYRWFFVMVGADPALFPGALGGGLEGPDWMTAGLNQNGRVTVRFVTRLDEAASFTMRHHSYLSGGPGPGDPSQFVVTARVRIDGVLAAP